MIEVGRFFLKVVTRNCTEYKRRYRKIAGEKKMELSTAKHQTGGAWVER